MTERAFEIRPQGLTGDATAQEISPGELAERRRFLCEAAGPSSERARQAPIGVIQESGDRRRDFAEGSASSICVVGMAQPSRIKGPPEVIRLKGGEIRDRSNEDLMHALFLYRAHKMVAVDQVKNLRRAPDDGRD